MLDVLGMTGRSLDNLGVALDPSVLRGLGRLVLRARAYVLVEAVAVLAGAWACAFAVQVALDYWLRLGRAPRGVMLAFVVLVLAWIVRGRIVPVLRVRLDAADGARLVEQFHPRLATALISAVRFSSGQIGPEATNSRELASAVVREANREVGALDTRRLLSARRAVVSGVVLVVMAGCLGIWYGVCASSLGIALRRTMLLSSEGWPKQTILRVDVAGDVLTAARGDDVEIRARAEGVVPRGVEVVYETASGEQGRAPMTSVGDDGFRYTFLNLREPLAFHLEGGDDRTAPIRIQLRDRPGVIRTQVRVEPPAYSGLEPVVLPDGRRSVRFLPGSRITLGVRTNKAVAWPI